MESNKHGPRPQNPVLQRLARKAKQSPAYHASAGLEKKLATRTGGYRTAGSGNKLEKGDVRIRGVARLEHKATQNKSFSVTREMLDKIELAGIGCDETPVMVIDFLDERGKSVGREIAVLPFKMLEDLIDERTAKGDRSGNAKPENPSSGTGKVRRRPHPKVSRKQPD